MTCRTLWVFLLFGWTVSAADRALTGPVVTWMIENDVAFLKAAGKPYALGGLIVREAARSEAGPPERFRRARPSVATASSSTG
jgi:hypothetical protein